MKKVIIFDFDGVLADSFTVIYELNRVVAEGLGKSLSSEELRSCFETHINEGLARLYQFGPEEKEKMVTAKALLFSKYLTPENIKLFPFAKELIVEASKIGELYIVSTAPGESIRRVLERENLASYFKEIIGQNKLPKVTIFKTLLQDKKDDKIFFITDTTGDIKETQKTDIHFHIVAVTWGYHAKELLKSENPEYLVDRPEEITSILKS